MDVNEYFRTETNRRLVDIEKKIDKLLAFKWQIIGGSLISGALVSLAVAFIAELVKDWH